MNIYKDIKVVIQIEDLKYQFNIYNNNEIDYINRKLNGI